MYTMMTSSLLIDILIVFVFIATYSILLIIDKRQQHLIKRAKNKQSNLRTDTSKLKIRLTTHYTKRS